MRVLAFTKTSAIGPSSRYRYYQFREPLAALGIRLECRPLFGKGWFAIRRLRPAPLRLVAMTVYSLARFAVRAKDVALAALSRERPNLIAIEHQLFPYLPALAERWLARRGRRFTVEFDDAIWKTPLHRKKLETLCRLAACVVTGNEFLAEFARRAGGRAEVVPTTIDLARYPPSDRAPRSGPLTIGWIGLPYNFGMLEAIQGSLARLARERPFVLRVISSGKPELPGVTVEAVEWSLHREVEELRRLDVGIMPLHDDEWSRGKCALKILQYFAAGVPVVASPVGVNRDVVQSGNNGLLADSPDGWYESLKRLIDDPVLRARLGAAGRRVVESRFDRDTWAPALASIWRAAAENK